MYIKRHLETTIEKLSGCCKVQNYYFIPDFLSLLVSWLWILLL